eukprot:CAMPEP_0202851308 /NCGR_PEP_ID=MMETSP1389-20130828/86010_1 /ASSEMBLY_ACC=CAM_ASM_000865 /TAXON_ID=302021 /ORGANISM="Rhodomonas sp., Strain CCMP768" /LENGTH=30 /DNA_ID= /DNA_START= /DNA_END= /DNA_ORIENTATION=
MTPSPEAPIQPREQLLASMHGHPVARLFSS